MFLCIYLSVCHKSYHLNYRGAKPITTAQCIFLSTREESWRFKHLSCRPSVLLYIQHGLTIPAVMGCCHSISTQWHPHFCFFWALAQKPEQRSKVKHQPVCAACMAQTWPHTGTCIQLAQLCKSLLLWVSPAPRQRLCGARLLNLCLSLHNQQKRPDFVHWLIDTTSQYF